MIIELELGMYYSQGDEDRFFLGLKTNRAVVKFRGAGNNLLVTVNSRNMTKEGLWDLIALLWRYKVPLRPLKIFAQSKKFSWLNNKEMFWYKDMFKAASK